MKILIVDDNQDNIDMIGFLLQKNNYTVDSAPNGKIALEKLRSEAFDFIISDILMPVMDGFKFCIECKNDEKLKDILFVFYTATYIDQKDEDFALSLGAQKFIRKPQEPDVLLSIIKEVSENPDSKSVNNVLKEDKETLKLYNERLISKLEKRNIDLEKEIEAHKKTLNELIRAKEIADENDKLKSAFLANMSHEIRTPLNTIVGFSNLMSQRDADSSTYAKMAHYIGFNSKVLIKIIDDILDVSKIESGTMTINKERIDINEILTHVISANEITKTDLLRENIELRCKCNQEKGFVVADKTRLVQILNNLILNALKFTDEGYVEVGCNVIGNATVQFYVKDTGVGISEDEISKIFTRFYKVNNDFNTFRGMGLGLSISKEFIERMGGDLHVESEVNVGSTFYFNLPYIKDEQLLPEKQENKVLANLKDKHILIAEDDNGNYMLARMILKRAGAIVIRAENGLEAVQICQENNEIDAILMDIKMPVMDGIEATKIIRETNRELIIVAVTAFAYAGLSKNISSVGFNDIITKPVDFNLLLSALGNI